MVINFDLPVSVNEFGQRQRFVDPVPQMRSLFDPDVDRLIMTRFFGNEYTQRYPEPDPESTDYSDDDFEESEDDQE